MTLYDVFQVIKKRIRQYDDEHNYTCDVCSREVFDHKRVCSKCYSALPWNDAVYCPLCGRKELESGICLECKQRPPDYDKARSCFSHEGEAVRLVLRFKRGDKFLYRTLCDFLQPLFLKEYPKIDILTFVPMTKTAEKRRGYNQSRLLAEELALRCDKTMDDLVEKRRDTDEQKTLGREARMKNLEGCFHVRDRKTVNGKSILVIDDILTTGATAEAMANVLYRAGAHSVYVLTITSVSGKNQFGVRLDGKKRHA